MVTGWFQDDSEMVMGWFQDGRHGRPTDRQNRPPSGKSRTAGGQRSEQHPTERRTGNRTEPAAVGCPPSKNQTKRAAIGCPPKNQTKRAAIGCPPKNQTKQAAVRFPPKSRAGRKSNGQTVRTSGRHPIIGVSDRQMEISCAMSYIALSNGFFMASASSMSKSTMPPF